jgi:hypothetical protein
MALASDLAAAFSLIQQQQALEERKEERHQNLALNLLMMEMRKTESTLDRQAGLIDSQLVRAEKKYDLIYSELETSKQDFSELTGQLYKAPDKDKTVNAVGVVNDIGGPVLDSLNQLLTDTQAETQGLMSQKADIGGQMRQARLIQDFYTGVGHDYSAGDPTKWDVADFSEEELSEYISQYPELAGVDQGAFYEGMKTRGAANLLGNMTALNAAIDQAKSANLTASMKQLDFDVKQENMPAAQIEQDILTIDKGVHSMLQSQANVLNNNFLAPAIQAIIEFATSQTPSNPEGDPDLETVKEDQLILVGSQISGLPADSQNEDVRAENLRLGRVLVLGNQNYVNSIKGHLAGTGDLDYVGYANALQEIQFFGENARRQLEDGKITRDQYLVYKNQLERITGKNLNEFSSDMNLVMQAADQVENKGATLAIAGMKDQYEKYVPSIDYEVPEDYISPSLVLPDSSAVLPDSTMIFPDSSTTLPDTSSILIDDPTIAIPYKEGSMTGAEFDYDATYFQGRDRAALRAMSFPTHLDPNDVIGDVKGQMSDKQHQKNQINSIIGSVVRLETYGMGDEATVLDAKIKDGRVVVKITPSMAHPGSWKGIDGDAIYLEDLEVISLQRAATGMPTAFVSGVPYYYDPMEDKYIIQSNRLKD